jgi:hypothetical protein
MMAEPFIFIGTHTVKEGKLEDFKQHFQEFCAFIEENEPRLIHFALYISEDDKEVSVVQVHPDEDSMAFQASISQRPTSSWTTRRASRYTERPAALLWNR